MQKKILFPTILAYAGLGLALLGAIPGFAYSVQIFKTGDMVPRSWADFSPLAFALFGLVLASAGALLALIGAIIAEISARPRYLWIAMVVISSACIASFSGVYYDPRHSLNWSDILFWLMFLIPMVLCIIAGIVIGLMRRLKIKHERE